MKKGPESKEILDAISAANKASKNKKIWKEVKDKLLNSRRNRKGVNVSKISKYVDQGKTAVIPAKVLGSGEINHKLMLLH
jgi:large subunit ribosomal protein L18e